MNLTVGRVALGDTDVSWEQAGSGVRVSGSTNALTRDQAVTLRQQLLGYVDNPDESFVPVVSADEPDFDGFYRVVGVSVSGAGNGAYLGRSAWSVDLQRVLSGRAASIEVTSVGGYRSNAHSWTAPVDQEKAIYLPPMADQIRIFQGGAIVDSQKSLVAGALALTPIDAAPWHMRPNGVLRVTYSVPPGGFYGGAATVKHNGKPVVGRWSSLTLGTMVVTNESIEATLYVGTGASGLDKTLTVSVRSWVHLGAGVYGWTTPVNYYVATTTAMSLNKVGPVLAVRNSPEQVTVRIGVNNVTASQLDISVRRGDPFVTGSIRMHPLVASETPRIYSAAASGGTLTSGAYETSDGLRTFVSPQALTVTDGHFRPDLGLSSWRFGIGRGATIVAGTSTPIAKQYKFTSSQRQAVVVP